MIDWRQRAQFAQDALLATDCVHNGAVFPTWIDDHHFWYERRGEDGPEYAVFNARAGERLLTLSRASIAGALASILDAPVAGDVLIVRDLRFELDGGIAHFSAFGQAFSFAYRQGVLTKVDKPTANANWLVSPQGGSALLLDGDNLKLRDLESGEERLLTTDGTSQYPYASPAAAMRRISQAHGMNVPQAQWSPDGKWVMTLQTDERHVPELALAEYAPVSGVRPVIHANLTSLPEDPKVTEFRMLVIEVETGRQVEARYPRLSAVRMNTTPFAAGLTWWSANSQTAYFVDVERGERKAHVVAFDVMTGATRIVFTEESPTYVELSVNVYTKALITPLPETNELIWYSERTGRGHLYLYDLTTGSLRRAITEGDWQVRDVLRVDADRREVVFLAAGIVPEENPYVVKPCTASLDGGMRILSDLPGEHTVWRPGDMTTMIKALEGCDAEKISGISPNGDYLIETVSTVEKLPVTYLRNQDGEEIVVLERASAELPVGWQTPEALEFLAADGSTRTYGLLFKPFGYESGRKYPLIDLIYGGPQVNYVPHGSFADGGITASAYADAEHLSALGAYVLILDGRGTANREQAFRTASHGAAHTASNLEDHIVAIRQLAERTGEIDLERVGITGFSGGGYMTAHAALRFGHFFKVAVAGGGNYDQALFWHSWGERYHGAYEADLYAQQAAKTYADGLKGKLLLVHGMMDNGCHPAGLFQLVQKLVEADKDVDLVLLPRGGHDWTGYGMRRRWQYFATHLMNDPPPAMKSFERPFDKLMARIAANRAISDGAGA
ncbi:MULTISPECIES: S9 family peptidase [Sphingomonas]|jgi:dipeptidyl-peptidase 4|uniref:S9 family peptidase n=1 Tax=Sphingomonas zeae TaxID=1646122 RepID=A0A7Y6B833_9SPHN|nr:MULTISPECIES: DPP IV N-terminal domain-containing protein [Sphingomonas]MBB4047014.1 dienelactone hydrolase [Sphingomonas zeae]MDK8186813.1 DPP IV N-terminal domain-containing protein [Sphingomonas zeae]MDK8214196.1 DPP IV N-terminal domain-containing protein [Sphingomonas sp. UMB7805-LC452B]NUU49119.1 S9 family peptidase [Sphingomonas zeae]